LFRVLSLISVEKLSQTYGHRHSLPRSRKSLLCCYCCPLCYYRVIRSELILLAHTWLGPRQSQGRSRHEPRTGVGTPISSRHTPRMQKILHFGGLYPHYFAFRQVRSKSLVFGSLKCKIFAFSSTIFCISTLLIRIPWILLGSLSSGHANASNGCEGTCRERSIGSRDFASACLECKIF
jgi:hypothetical protein